MKIAFIYFDDKLVDTIEYKKCVRVVDAEKNIVLETRITDKNRNLTVVSNKYLVVTMEIQKFES